MKTKPALVIGLLLTAGAIFPGLASAEEIKTLKLLPAQKGSGKPLMQALAERKSAREFNPEELPLQTLSDLLWAADGVNRPDGGRTAPSAHNAQAIDIYVAKKEALYLYDAKGHELTPVLKADARSHVGSQPFLKDAPVVLIFVADLKKFHDVPEKTANFYNDVGAGFLSQNVYLYCASEGLSTVSMGWFDRKNLARAMHLRTGQRAILVQPVGYPKNKK
jgi:nitroreductase